MRVQDPKLAEHLARWGIDVLKVEKTDKTMAELEVRDSVRGALVYMRYVPVQYTSHTVRCETLHQIRTLARFMLYIPLCLASFYFHAFTLVRPWSLPCPRRPCRLAARYGLIFLLCSFASLAAISMQFPSNAVSIPTMISDCKG